MIYVALLRGINVGGKNLIKMAELKSAFESFGFTDVQSYIQSGNVIFGTDISDKAVLETMLEKSLSEAFDYESKIMVRSLEDMRLVVSSIPKIFEDISWKHNVIFLSDRIDSLDIIDNFIIKPEIETVTYLKGTLFWSAKLDMIGRSTMLKLSTRKEYKEMTVRNVNTTRKIFELMSINN